MRVCIADDNDVNARLMQRKLLSMDALLHVQLLSSAQEACEQFQHFDVLVMENGFGPGNMTGVEAIEAIRQQEEHAPEAMGIVIALWTAEDVPHAPGADLIWDKAISPRKMWDQLLPILPMQ